MRTPLSLLAAGAIALVPILATPAWAAPPSPGQDLVEWCLLNGGQTIPQPPDSPIAACCTEDGCIICASDWTDCSFDPPYSRPNAGQTQLNGADTLAPPSQDSSGLLIQVPSVRQVR